MKIDYEYIVHTMGFDGLANVEYKTPRFGSVTRAIVLPYDRGEEQIRRKIVENFPLDIFYSRYLFELSVIDDVRPQLLDGKMSVDFDDHFYDVQEMVTSEAKSP